MLIAVHNDQLVLAENAKSDMAYYCPGCGQGVILRRGKHKITHYAHKKGNDCGFLSPMGEKGRRKCCRKHTFRR